MTQKELIERMHKQTQALIKSIGLKLGIDISGKELAIDHVMGDVNSQGKDNYLIPHDETEFHNARQ